jgi:hypothetical protein
MTSPSSFVKYTTETYTLNGSNTYSVPIFDIEPLVYIECDTFFNVSINGHTLIEYGEPMKFKKFDYDRIAKIVLARKEGYNNINDEPIRQIIKNQNIVSNTLVGMYNLHTLVPNSLKIHVNTTKTINVKLRLASIYMLDKDGKEIPKYVT